MAERTRKKADQALLTALACGATVEAAARQCGLCVRTVYRRLKDPKFKRRLARLKAEFVGRTTGMLTAAGGEAVKTLITLQRDNQPPATRLGAARSVLELGIKLRESVELEERIAALEDQMASEQGRGAGPILEEDDG